MTVYGYARVSSADQNLARQIDALLRFPVDRGCIFTDKRSGATFERPGWKRMVNGLREDDVLVVLSIDRLGRDYDEIIAQWHMLTHEKNVDICVLDMPLLDTREGRGGVTKKLVTDIVLQLLSYVAQVERENTRRRQAEGIAAAKARGARFGRPPLARPRNYTAVKCLVDRGLLTRKAAASELGVSTSTLTKWFHQDLQAEGADG